jgi:hypothetical protein
LDAKTEALSHPLVRERAYPLGAAARPGMVQEQDVRAGEPAADLAAAGPELLDDLAVEISHGG